MNTKILRKILVYSALIILSTLIQFNYPESLRIYGNIPDILLILSVLTAYLFGAYDGIAIALICGLIKDVYAGRALGLGMLMFIYCALITSYIVHKIFSSGFLPSIFAGLFSTIIYMIVSIIFSLIIYDSIHSATELLSWWTIHRLLPSILLNSLSAIFISALFMVIPPYKKEEAPPEYGFMGGDGLSIKKI